MSHIIWLNFLTDKKGLMRSNEFKVKSRSFLTGHQTENNFFCLKILGIHKIFRFHFGVEVFYRQVVIGGHLMVIWGRKWFFIGPTKFYYPCSYLTLSLSGRPPLLVQSVTGRPGQIWPCALNHHVPRDPMWPNRWQKLVVDKKSGRLIYLGMLRR